MIVLGIDPGTSRLGWAIVEKKKEERIIAFDCFFSQSKDLASKLKEIDDFLEEVFRKYKPNLLALEKVFYGRNQKTVIQIAKLLGIVILKAKKKNLEIIEISPNEVKKAITGWGFSQKREIKNALFQIFPCLKEEKKNDDAYDALATALVACRLIR